MLSIKVVSATPLADMRLLVVFENGVAKLFDVRPIMADYPEYAALENPDLFALVQVEAGGYGVSWTSELDASEGELWQDGVELPLTAADLRDFVARNVVDTSEVCELLSCTRQNVDDLVRRRKLAPVHATSRSKLFLRSEVSTRLPG